MTTEQQNKAWLALTDSNRDLCRKVYEASEDEPTLCMLETLYGVENLTSQKETGPKFKVGDKVTISSDCRINDTYRGKTGTVMAAMNTEQYRVAVGPCSGIFHISHLAPYTEPTDVHEDNFASKEPKSDEMEDEYYCDMTYCLHNGEGYLKPKQCDKVLCPSRIFKRERWWPKSGEEYYEVSAVPETDAKLGVGWAIADEEFADLEPWCNLMVFRTEDLANQAAEAVKACLLKFHKDHQQ